VQISGLELLARHRQSFVGQPLAQVVSRLQLIEAGLAVVGIDKSLDERQVAWCLLPRRSYHRCIPHSW
jgi:hypothetical protein